MARAMQHLEEFLLANGYTGAEGFFTRSSEAAVEAPAEQTWSKLARADPVYAAAATRSDDPFAKYPDFVDRNIDDGPQVILDAGCGYGRVAIPLLEKYPTIRIVGIDASPVMLHRFLDLLHEVDPTAAATTEQRALLVHSDLSSMPFPDASFDTVFSSAVLLHNPYAVTRTIIGEMYRLLKPGGRAIFVGSFYNRYTLEGLMNAAYLKVIDEARTNGPVRVYTRRNVPGLFSAWSALTVESRGAITLPRRVGTWNVPFGDTIRGLNAWTEKQLRSRGVTTLLAQYFDVVATK